MTDNEIIKALECCLKDCNAEGCEDCPLYEKVEDCEIEIPIIALDLINRQKVEIERLKNHFVYGEVHNHIAIEIGAEHAIIEAVKPQIIREFAEKLKHKCRDSVELDDYRITVVTKSDIDDLVEEMVGDTDD